MFKIVSNQGNAKQNKTLEREKKDLRNPGSRGQSVLYWLFSSEK